MKRALYSVIICLLLPFPASAQQQGFQDRLLDHFAGNWIMKGTIAGEEIIHDVEADWVLAHNYLRFHELSREIDKEGFPEYEAIVFIGWNESSNRYACLWLDVTGGEGLSAEGIGYAEPNVDKLPFVFDTGSGGVIHTTFSYIRDNDTWKWTIDIERDGELKQFARVTLTRKQ